MNAEELAQRISQLALEKKGQNIVILDLRELTDITDFFVIVSGESDIHVKTLVNHIEKQLKEEGVRVWHIEGYQRLNWVLMDYVDVVVHIFRPEIRAFYGLELLWADAKMTRVEDHADHRIVSEGTD